NRGYICSSPQKCTRIIQVCHTDERIEEELHAIVDCGGTVEDVFVQHEVYGELRAVLNIRSRREVKQFLEDIRTGKSKPLTNITSGHHCHTISADSEEILDMIEENLRKLGICME
ncbi:MAG TPA: GNAT family N-acetyltransferase, partial [Candidatus Blautia stercoravium]|nr:GNAT family N-acetyltransferase [Candidatus Blautia stercoravium]